MEVDLWNGFVEGKESLRTEAGVGAYPRGIPFQFIIDRVFFAYFYLVYCTVFSILCSGQ